jgi:hypothetical protein
VHQKSEIQNQQLLLVPGIPAYPVQCFVLTADPNVDNRSLQTTWLVDGTLGVKVEGLQLKFAQGT